MQRRFLIESVLPIRKLSEEARREKAIRHGHISTLHVWWARRPLVVARAAVLGALLDAEDASPEFIANLCKWEVHDGDPSGRYLLDQARHLIRKRFGDHPPKVLDSFAGGGSIPLEALRLGCEAYAVEYNPVAYLILKATIEYPQRYGQRLVEAVKRWGEWVLERAKAELAEFYPQVGGETPIAYIWSRTIRCPNFACGAEIPLFRQFWLARKQNKKVALKPIRPSAASGFHSRCHNNNSVGDGAPTIQFVIVQGHEIDFDPSEGTVRRGNAVCLVCNTSARDDYVKAEAQAGRMGHRLVAVVTTRGRGQGRNYRLATDEDMSAFQKAEEALQKLIQTPSPWAFGLPWVPEEPSPGTIGQGASKRPTYGLTTWGKFFNPRQLLALCTFGKWVRAAHQEILRQSGDAEFAKAVVTYLGLAMDSMANYNSLLSAWRPSHDKVEAVFIGHHLHMTWDYAERNGAFDAWNNAMAALFGGLQNAIQAILKHCASPSAGIHLGSAISLPFADKTFDAVIIDPPYADNVPYADLSDFFYVWLRRTVGDLYPEAFQMELTPKDEEAVVNPARFGGGKKGEQVAQAHYRRLMQASFSEVYRVLKPEGMCVVMFTHRSTAAWERLIQSLLDAGLYPTASFPVHTEMEASTHQRGKGAIQSTILMACRRRPENAGIGWYQQVRSELQQVIPERLREFWDEGIRGADFFISAIGPCVGIFGRYRKVMRPDGTDVTVSDLLGEARSVVTAFALQQLGLAALDAPTRFYVLYRWAYGGDSLDFDDANKLAKSVGVELDELEQTHGLIVRKKDEVSVPIFAERVSEGVFAHRLKRALEAGEGGVRDGTLQKGVRDRTLQKGVRDRTLTLQEIDQIHLSLWWWQKGEREKLSQFLATIGVTDDNHPFWRTAQAILEVEQAQQNGDIEKEARALSQLLGSKQGLLREAITLSESAQQFKLEL